MACCWLDPMHLPLLFALLGNGYQPDAIRQGNAVRMCGLEAGAAHLGGCVALGREAVIVRFIEGLAAIPKAFTVTVQQLFIARSAPMCLSVLL